MLPGLIGGFMIGSVVFLPVKYEQIFHFIFNLYYALVKIFSHSVCNLKLRANGWVCG